MTPEEKTEWLNKVVPLFKTHLTATIGYPGHGDNALIMAQLPALFNLLGENRLIVSGMTYQMFYHHAERKYMEVEFAGILGF